MTVRESMTKVFRVECSRCGRCAPLSLSPGGASALARADGFDDSLGAWLCFHCQCALVIKATEDALAATRATAPPPEPSRGASPD